MNKNYLLLSFKLKLEFFNLINEILVWHQTNSKLHCKSLEKIFS